MSLTNFADNFKSPAYKKNNHPCKTDFIEFGKRIGVDEKRIGKLLALFLEKNLLQEELVKRSFLDDANKRGYQMMYNARRNYLIG
ncbi:hypothetical protein BH09BAC5_BH09BAC5_05280 [soil metagenome]